MIIDLIQKFIGLNSLWCESDRMIVVKDGGEGISKTFLIFASGIDFSG